jgi:diguanylate cyclase
MNTEKQPKLYIWLIKNHKIITVVFTVLMLIGFYFYIRTRQGDHTAYTHIMYIVIVFSGSILGGYFGVATALVAGILVGPLLPYDLVSGEPQQFSDWFFRLVMMLIVGLMSGYFSKNYRYVQDRVKSLLTVNAQSNLHNINYLGDHHFDHDKSYLIMSMIIDNYKMLSEVVGYKVYYDYLLKIQEALFLLFPEGVFVQAEENKFWFIIASYDSNLQIDKISKEIKSINQVQKHKLFVDFGLGFHEIRLDHKVDISSYFTDADLAANQAIKNHVIYQRFSNISTDKKYEYELLSDFEEALTNGDIFLVYQPKINLNTRKTVGLEALIRWHHPIKKMIYPDQFIHAIEETSLVHKMTEEVFRKSLEFQKKLIKMGIEVPISINVSTKNLYDMSFYDQMTAIFQTYDIHPNMVELEITETVLMEKPELSKTILEKFAAFGFKIAIDDFGKGYSSLAYLAQFPINTVKVDRYFTNQILVSPTTQAIVGATVNLVLQLGYEVLIEGVEDAKTADLLESYGCQSAQGYFFLKPQKELTITEYLIATIK